MLVAVRQSFEPRAWPRADVVVLVDVFRASTTLAALLSRGVSEILATNDEVRALSLAGEGRRLVSEVFAGGLDNSPSQVLATVARGERVVHKTTNLTTVLFDVLPTAGRVWIGGFVNLGRVVDQVRGSGAERVEVVAAAHFALRAEAPEDSSCVRHIAAALRNEAPRGVENLAGIRASVAKGRYSERYLADVEIALDLDSLPWVAEARARADGLVEMVSVSGSAAGDAGVLHGSGAQA